MNEIFSRKLQTNLFYERIRKSIKSRQLLNLRRVLSITEGRTMPDITRLEIGSAKKMTASVLFFDIAKFTTTTSELPPEYTLYILNLIIPSVMRIVRMCNGNVEKNTGDGIMAIFGTETPDRTVIAREAIEAALLIKHFMINDIHEHLSSLGLPALNFRIGIDMDELLIARIGYNNNSFLTAVGNAANRASKLQSLAETNGICIGESLAHNIHSSLHQYCYQGSDESWNWTMQGSTIAYRYFHFDYKLSEPPMPPTIKPMNPMNPRY